MSNFFNEVSYDIPEGNPLLHDKDVDFISQYKIIDLVTDLEIIFSEINFIKTESIDFIYTIIDDFKNYILTKKVTLNDKNNEINNYESDKYLFYDNDLINCVSKDGDTYNENFLFDNNTGINSNGILNIGSNNDELIDINIGCSNNIDIIDIGTSNIIDKPPININIGSENDIINIKGLLNYVTTNNIQINNNNLILKKTDINKDFGLLISCDNDNKKSYILYNNNNYFEFKSPNSDTLWKLKTDNNIIDDNDIIIKSYFDNKINILNNNLNEVIEEVKIDVDIYDNEIKDDIELLYNNYNNNIDISDNLLIEKTEEFINKYTLLDNNTISNYNNLNNNLLSIQNNNVIKINDLTNKTINYNNNFNDKVENIDITLENNKNMLNNKLEETELDIETNRINFTNIINDQNEFINEIFTPLLNDLMNKINILLDRSNNMITIENSNYLLLTTKINNILNDITLNFAEINEKIDLLYNRDDNNLNDMNEDITTKIELIDNKIYEILNNTSILTPLTNDKLNELSNKLEQYSNNIHDRIENVTKINLTNLENRLETVNNDINILLVELNNIYNNLINRDNFDNNYNTDIDNLNILITNIDNIIVYKDVDNVINGNFIFKNNSGIDTNNETLNIGLNSLVINIGTNINNNIINIGGINDNININGSIINFNNIESNITNKQISIGPFDDINNLQDGCGFILSNNGYIKYKNSSYIFKAPNSSNEYYLRSNINFDNDILYKSYVDNIYNNYQNTYNNLLTSIQSNISFSKLTNFPNLDNKKILYGDGVFRYINNDIINDNSISINKLIFPNNSNLYLHDDGSFKELKPLVNINDLNVINDINLSNQRISNLGDGVDLTDAINYGQVKNIISNIDNYININSININKFIFNSSVDKFLCDDGQFRTLTEINNLVIPTSLNDLYNFYKFTFSSCNKIGRLGPSLDECLDFYDIDNNEWLLNTNNYNNLNGIQYWTCPRTGIYNFIICGPNGSNIYPNLIGGKSRYIHAKLYINRGAKIKMLIGQRGNSSYYSYINNNITRYSGCSGGSGATFVCDINNNLLICSAGGGSAIHQYINNNIEFSSNGIDTFKSIYGSDNNGNIKNNLTSIYDNNKIPTSATFNLNGSFDDSTNTLIGKSFLNGGIGGVGIIDSITSINGSVDGGFGGGSGNIFLNNQLCYSISSAGYTSGDTNIINIPSVGGNYFNNYYVKGDFGDINLSDDGNGFVSIIYTDDNNFNDYIQII